MDIEEETTFMDIINNLPVSEWNAAIALLPKPIISDQTSPFKTKYPELKDIPTLEKFPEVDLSGVCKDHISMFERGVGMNVLEFLALPNRLHLALSKAVPIYIGPPTLVDGGEYSWQDLYCGFIGIGSELWSATDFELEVVNFIGDIAHEWVEMGCWCADDGDDFMVTYLKWYGELMEAANQYQQLSTAQ